jgi:hypothetical protein
MTSVGFENVPAETDNEKIFTICMMITAGKAPYTSFCTIYEYIHLLSSYFSMSEVTHETIKKV